MFETYVAFQIGYLKYAFIFDNTEHYQKKTFIFSEHTLAICMAIGMDLSPNPHLPLSLYELSLYTSVKKWKFIQLVLVKIPVI